MDIKYRQLQPVLGTMLITAAVLLSYRFAWDSIDSFVRAIDHTDLLFADFVRHYYPMGRVVFDSHLPVEGFYYPPLFALALSLPASLSLKNAIWGWGTIQVVSAFLIALIPGCYFWKRSQPMFYLCFLLTLSSYPLLHNFKWGQASVLVMLCVLTSFVLYDRKRIIVAAMILSAAVAIKYYAVLFLILFLFRRDFRFLKAFAAGSVLFWVLIPLAFFGVDDTIRFYEVLTGSFFGLADWTPHDINSQYIAHVAARIWPTISSGVWPAILGYMVAVGNIFLLYKTIRKKLDLESLWALTLIFTTLPNVLITSWPHYFVYLPLAQVFVGHAVVRGNSQRLVKSLQVILLIIPSVIFSSIYFFNIIDDRILYVRNGYLFFSNLLLLLAIWWHLCPRLFGQQRVSNIARSGDWSFKRQPKSD
ncbi:MAG: DUF2029 domain-containing protein [FCB group bacterium]|nr:DUF2029 domain-containing protein [FCB group bacterium]